MHTMIPSPKNTPSSLWPSALLVKRDTLALLCLALITLLFFYPLWGQGGWLPRGGGDSVSFLYPMYRFIAQSWRAGQLPLWNPHQYAGYPLIADNQAGIFYPLHLLLFFLRPTFSYQALELSVGFHLFWAGAGMYLCAREIGRFRPTVALFAAIPFMFSDLFITHLGNLNLIAVIAWLPWCVGGFARACRRNSPAWAMTAGLMLGISTLAGHGQMSFFIAFFLALYAVWAAVALRSLTPLWFLVLVAVVGAGVAAITVVPSYFLNRYTQRGEFSYEQSVNYSLPWRGVVGLIAPHFFGRGSAEFWGEWPRVEYGYLGLAPLLFSLWARPTSFRHKTAFPFFILAAIFFLLLALGSNTPLHRWVFAPLALPFQVPARMVVLFDFCLALLGAAGLQQLLDAPPRWGAWQNKLILALLLFGGGGLWWWQGRFDPAHAEQMVRATEMFLLLGFLSWGVILARWQMGLLALCIVSADLFWNGQYVEIEWNNPLQGYQNRGAIAYLQEKGEINRIDEATALWQASSAQINQLYSIGGVFNPLQLARHANYLASVGYRGSSPYNLLGVKYIVADKTEPPGDTNWLAPVFDDEKVTIWLNRRALPRVLLFYRTVVADSAESAFALLHGGLDLTQTLIVEQGEPLDQLDGEHTIAINQYSPNRVVIDVTLNRRGYLFLSDLYFPDWVATVEGQTLPIVPAHYAFRAVLLEPGHHLLTFTFRPTAFFIGAAITLTTLVGVALWFGRKIRGDETNN